MKHNVLLFQRVTIIVILLFIFSVHSQGGTRQMEYLDRGGIAMKTNTGVYLSWRVTGEDGKEASFNIYRNGILVNPSPLSGATNYEDNQGTVHATYRITCIKSGVETDDYKDIPVWNESFLRVPLNCPPDGVTPSGEAYTYKVTGSPAAASTECAIADLDGDGEYEIIVKWEPSNWKDNSQKGLTGNTYIDAYKLDGTQLWRIDLGKNIRSGPHYTQLMVYDFDGDGMAEVICKTAPGTIDGLGNYVVMAGDDPTADYRTLKTSGNNWIGFITKGPEYLTLFDGLTGAEKHTVAYEPARGNVSDWGDNYGNRADRFLACVAYLDGVKPSVVMTRGYYERAALVAYDVIDGKLVKKWMHDAKTKGQGAYGEGNHNLSVADVDGDGFDEIIFGACVIDHDGTLLYRTGFGHGDAMHVAKMDPDREGYQVFCVHEETWSPYGYEFRDAGTGQVIFGNKTGSDIGRGMAADIDSRYPGYEVWPIEAEKKNGNKWTPVFDCKGNVISESRPRVTFRVYWTGDLQDELMEDNLIYKWNESTNKDALYKTFASNGAVANSNNRPCILADIFGDWREEIALLNKNCELMIFTTTEPTEHRLYTLMHDPLYRLGVAWQNVAYNQPPHFGHWIGGGTENIPWPEMTVPRVEPKIVMNREALEFNKSISYIDVHAIPLGGLKIEDVKWEVEDPSVIAIQPNPRNKYGVTVEAIKKGTTCIKASSGSWEQTIPVNVSDVRVRLYTWTPSSSATWDDEGNYTPNGMPGAGDTVIVKQEMEINASPFTAAILLQEANLRLRADAVSTGNILMSEGTAISFATSGTGFSLHAPIQLHGNVTVKIGGSMENGNMKILGLSGNITGTSRVIAHNNTNSNSGLAAGKQLVKVLLSGDNSNFTGTWTTRESNEEGSMVAFDGVSENAFGRGEILIGEGHRIYFSHTKAVSSHNELTLLTGAKAILSENVTVGKLILNGEEYTSGTFNATSHPEFFEGSRTLTVESPTSVQEAVYAEDIFFDGETLVAPLDMQDINVYMPTGVLVDRYSPCGNRMLLPLREGMYILDIRFVNGSISRKKIFIKE